MVELEQRCSSSAMSASWRLSSDWLRRARLTSRSDIVRRCCASAWAAATSVAPRSAMRLLLRCCTSSVCFQKMMTPTHAASTDTPWIRAHSHGLFCAA